MKKVLLSCALLMGLSAAAQTPSLDFETWSNYGIGDTDGPSGWITGNVLTSPIIAPNPSNPQEVFQATAAGDFHGGAKGARILTVKLATNPAPGILPDALGLIATGKITTSPSLGYKMGYPYTARPAVMTFWYKSSPMTGDTAGVSIALWKNQGGTRIYVGSGEFTTTSTVGTMTQQTVTILYDPTQLTVTPDSVSIIAGSSYHRSFLTPGSKVGSQLWIDDIQLTGGNVGILEFGKATSQISVYPNPANNYVNFNTDSKNAKTVSVYDVTGQLIGVYTMEEGKLKLQTSEFHNGIYMYNVTGESNQVLSSGKFTVAK